MHKAKKKLNSMYLSLDYHELSDFLGKSLADFLRVFPLIPFAGDTLVSASRNKPKDMRSSLYNEKRKVIRVPERMLLEMNPTSLCGVVETTQTQWPKCFELDQPANDGMRQRLRQGCVEGSHGCNTQIQLLEILNLWRYMDPRP